MMMMLPRDTLRHDAARFAVIMPPFIYAIIRDAALRLMPPRVFL